MMKWWRYPKKLRAYLKKYKRSLIAAGLMGFVIGEGPSIPFIIWDRLTDDGYGWHLPPDEIDPAPAPATPWRPIWGPESLGPESLTAETSTVAGGVQTLPRLTRADLKLFFFPKGFEDDITLTYPEYFGLVTRRFDRRPVALRNSGEGREAGALLLNL